MSDDEGIFSIDILDSDKNDSDKLADNLKKIGQEKLTEVRIKLFEDVYDNLLKRIKNNSKYMKKSYCLYQLPNTFNGIVLYDELKKCFMKHIVKRLYKENFKIKIIDKNTILIKW